MPRRRQRLIPLIAALFAGAAAVYLAGNANSPLLDRDEPRYAQCSREMLHGSPEFPGPDWVVPRMQGELRTAKPPLIYWCQAGVMSVIGDTAFAARLPSVLAALLTLAVWATALWRIVGPQRAAWSTFILATSMLFMLSAKWCTTDAVLLLFVTTAQLCLYAFASPRLATPLAVGSLPSNAENPPHSATLNGMTVLLGMSIAFAGLTKGPVVLGVLVMTLLVLRIMRWWDGPNSSATPAARINPLLFAIVIAAICGPWLWMIHQREPGFLPQALWHDVFTRSTKGLEGHGAPPGYHLLTIWGTYFPWSILLPASLVYAWRRRGTPVIRFAFATVVGTWLMFEIVWTKLPHYLLPLFPWLSLLTANLIVHGLRGLVRRPLARRALVAWAAVPTLIGLLPWLAAMKFDVPVVPSAIVTAAGVAVTLTTIALFLRHHFRPGLLTMGGGSLLLVAVLFGVYLPRAVFLRASIQAGDELQRMGASPVQMLGYKEPSIAFYQGGTIRENSAMRLGPKVIEQAPEVLVISDEVWRNSKPAERDRYDVVRSFPALNYAGGMRVQQVMIVRRRE